MPMPTWNGEPVDPGSARMVEAREGAYAMYERVMGSASFISNPDVNLLLRGIEAASWLARIGESGRDYMVPIAKAAGASWADLADAMGVSRGTAQYRYKKEAAEWAEDLRRAATPAAWEGVEPLTKTDPPENFEPTDDDFVRDERIPAWYYTGPLDPAIQYMRARHEGLMVYPAEDVHVVSSRGPFGSMSTTADTEEEAWRSHFASSYVRDKPYPDDARPGETRAEFKRRIGAE